MGINIPRVSEWLDKSGSRYALACMDGHIFLSNEEAYHRWMLDPQVTAHNSHGLFKKSGAEIDAWLERIACKEILCWAIMRMCGDDQQWEWIGTISLQRIDATYRSAEIALYIGEKAFWGRGIATEAVRWVTDHAHKRLNIHRVWSGTAETNIGMQRTFDKLGFVKEGIFRDAMFLDGKYVNVFCYSKLQGE